MGILLFQGTATTLRVIVGSIAALVWFLSVLMTFAVHMSEGSGWVGMIRGVARTPEGNLTLWTLTLIQVVAMGVAILCFGMGWGE